MNLIRLTSFLAALCIAQAAQAQETFSTPAAGCVPDDATIRNNRSLVGNASVRHAAGVVDPIVLTCTISALDSGSENWNLRMTYRDSTGTGTDAFVRVRLYRMAIGGATPFLLATVNSNDDDATVLNTLQESFEHPFNFTTNTYWFHIDLIRATTGQNVTLHTVTLSPPPAPSDMRLKHNIALLGRLDDGLGFYRFSYNGSDAAYVGLMAQEVQAVVPEAVTRGSDGYLRVFYSRLGLRMQTWEEWLAAGGKIPAMIRPMQ
jgi:hypothetical protein